MCANTALAQIYTLVHLCERALQIFNRKIVNIQIIEKKKAMKKKVWSCDHPLFQWIWVMSRLDPPALPPNTQVDKKKGCCTPLKSHRFCIIGTNNHKSVLSNWTSTLYFTQQCLLVSNASKPCWVKHDTGEIQWVGTNFVLVSSNKLQLVWCLSAGQTVWFL